MNRRRALYSPADVLLTRRDLPDIDIARVAAIAAALDFMRQRMAEDPAFFGVGKPLSNRPVEVEDVSDHEQIE